jgi:adenylate cyclase
MSEIERRFLIDRLPDELPEPATIEQAYLTVEPIAVRVRRTGDDRILTIKAGSGRTRTEIERDLDDDEFDQLWELGDALRITKRRHRIGLDAGLTAELDLFDGELAGRRLVEVEFPSEQAADAFDPPDWFGREVTTDVRYNNASLATAGWPTD